MNKPLRIENDPEVMKAIEALQNYMLKKGYTPEQLAEAVKRYWEKLDREEAKEADNEGN